MIFLCEEFFLERIQAQGKKILCKYPGKTNHSLFEISSFFAAAAELYSLRFSDQRPEGIDFAGLAGYFTGARSYTCSRAVLAQSDRMLTLSRRIFLFRVGWLKNGIRTSQPLIDLIA